MRTALRNKKLRVALGTLSDAITSRGAGPVEPSTRNIKHIVVRDQGGPSRGTAEPQYVVANREGVLFV